MYIYVVRTATVPNVAVSFVVHWIRVNLSECVTRKQSQRVQRMLNHQRMLRHPSHQRNQSRLSHPARKCLYQQDWLQVTLLTSQQTKNQPRWGKYASTWHGHGAIVEKFVEGMQVQAIERMVTHFAASKVACPWKLQKKLMLSFNSAQVFFVPSRIRDKYTICYVFVFYLFGDSTIIPSNLWGEKLAETQQLTSTIWRHTLTG